MAIKSRRFIANKNVFEYTAKIPQENPDEQKTEEVSKEETIKLAISNNQTVKLSMNKKGRL